MGFLSLGFFDCGYYTTRPRKNENVGGIVNFPLASTKKRWLLRPDPKGASDTHTLVMAEGGGKILTSFGT